MGACFAKYSVAEKQKRKERFEHYDSVDLQFVLNVRMLVYVQSITKDIKDLQEIEFLTRALASKDPHSIHIALHTYKGSLPHDTNECYYKTLAGCKCPMAKDVSFSEKYV